MLKIEIYLLELLRFPGDHIKKNIFPLKEIDHWTFPEEKKTCLTIFLKNKTSQKICSFSDDIETIKSISDKLYSLLG